MRDKKYTEIDGYATEFGIRDSIHGRQFSEMTLEAKFSVVYQ